MLQHPRSLFIMTIFILLFAFAYQIEATNSKQATIDVNIMNIRSGPGMEYSILGKLNKNTVHSIIEEKDRWYKVPFNNTEGWIAGWLVSVEESKVSNTPATTIKVVESQIAGLNVRTGPSTSFPVISNIKPSEFYPLVEDHGEWLKIQLHTKNDGWVAKNLVRITDKTMEAASNNKSVTIMATVLNVRSEPNTRASIVTKLSKGEQVNILEVKDGWYNISYNSITGWISAEFTQEITDRNINTPSDTITNEHTEGNTTIPTDNTNNATTDNSSDNASDTSNGADKKDHEELTIDDNQKIAEKPDENNVVGSETATVVVNILNVRSEPKTSARVIGKLHLQETVEVMDRQNDWLKITYNGETGWIADWLVSIQKAKQPISQVPQVIIPKTGINIRTGPDVTYSIIRSANEGDTFTIINTHGSWYEIQMPDSTVGFIASWVVQAIGIESTENNHSITGLLKGKTIVVDAGHGGIDAGAIGSHFRTLEKDITLSTALLLQSKLKAAGANVVMTRTTDLYLSLAQRVSISSSNKADAFVTVHYNTNHNPLINGTIVYHYSRNGDDAKLARIVQQEIVQRNGLQNLRARQGNYFVLRENTQLAILVEAAFISNYNDELVSRTGQFQDKVAEGIFQGVIKYFN